MVKLDDGSGVVSEDLLDLLLEVEWETMKSTTWTLWEVNEPTAHLDRETGEVRQGAVFEPIRELERTENRERGSARPEVEGSLAEMLL
jgi:hypothetical protein